MPGKEETLDARYATAARLLGLPDAKTAMQHSGLVGDLLYVWETPLGRTVLVETASSHMLFEPGILLPAALALFRQRREAAPQ
jgi:hypothetical protein